MKKIIWLLFFLGGVVISGCAADQGKTNTSTSSSINRSSSISHKGCH